MAKRKEALLKQTLWFQEIALDKNSLPTIMGKEQLLQLLDDKDLDYLREEEEFQSLYKKIQNS
ncbi:XRE family transcriptional regulator, partial [Eubacterium sp. AM47-9]